VLKVDWCKIQTITANLAISQDKLISRFEITSFRKHLAVNKTALKLIVTSGGMDLSLLCPIKDSGSSCTQA